ncbi:MAG: polyprenol monophosphomannose synthase [Nakamurella sp.]
MADHSVLVLIPTYNERENLPLILGRVRAAVPDADVLVLDDGSPDGTGAIADEWAAKDEHINVIHRPEKTGLCAAYIAGFRWGLKRGYALLVEMDADGSHAPEQLPRLLAAAAYADLVIGSRYVPGGATVNWSSIRKAISRGGNLYSRLALGVGVKDITAGYRAYRAEVLRVLELDSIESHGYCFQVDLSWRTIQAGFRVAEVPITFTERSIGESKMSGNIVREAFLKVGWWGVRHRVKQVRNLFGRAKTPVSAGR